MTPAQLAIGWCLRLSDKVIPIPGSSSVDRVKENLGAAHVSLTDEVRACPLRPPALLAGD